MSDAPVLQTRDLVKHFTGRRPVFGTPPPPLRAVQGVSLSVRRGQALGIVGESGCGKSTLAKMIMGLHEATSGSVLLEGREATEIPRKEFAQRVQFVFQDPYSSLNPRKTVRQALDAPLRHLAGIDAAARRTRIEELLNLVGLRREFADRYPHEFSGGQRQRVGIARALATNADVLLLDEPVSALDVSVQAQVLNLLRELQAELGLTYLFIAHDLAVVENLCDDVAVMYLGRIVEQAPAAELFAHPRHPYTHTLLSAIPDPDADGERLRVPAPDATNGAHSGEEGCAFAPRCYRAEARCRDEHPNLDDAAAIGHPVACHFADDTDPQEHLA